MKKALFLFSILAVMSCSKDDEHSIVGKWALDYIIVEKSKDGFSNIPITNCEGEVYEFTKDGKSLFTDKILIRTTGECVNDQTKVSYYQYDSGSKILTIAGETHQVRKLTATELVFVQKEIDFDNDGITDYYVLYMRRM